MFGANTDPLVLVDGIPVTQRQRRDTVVVSGESERRALITEYGKGLLGVTKDHIIKPLIVFGK